MTRIVYLLPSSKLFLSQNETMFLVSLKKQSRLIAEYSQDVDYNPQALDVLTFLLMKNNPCTIKNFHVLFYSARNYFFI